MPRDVDSLLQRYSMALPAYFDARQLLRAQEARRRWPMLRCIASTAAATESESGA